AGAASGRRAKADRSHQRADVDRAFRRLDTERRHHVPPRSGACWRRRRVRPAMRSGARNRARFLRALFSRISVRHLGGEVGARGEGTGDVRNHGRGLITAGPSAETPGAPPDANKSLRAFSGLIALIGAGKMGGALLEGWLRLGLDPRKVAVLEPQPL